MSLPPLQPLSAHVSAAPQLEASAMALVAQAGFKSGINNRPDHEGGAEQPTSAAIEAAALAAGLSYRHLPVAPGYQSPDEIARFRGLIDALPKPILVFCRTGIRSGKLFQAAASA